MTTTPASLLLLVFAIGAAPEAASLSVPRDESAAQPASAPAAFVASRLLGSTAPAELLWTKSGCIPSFTHRRRRPTAMGSQMGILDGLKEALRGGGPFRRETNAAKYRNRPRLGIDISNRMATALSALSVALVAGALPLWYGSAQGLWQSFWLTRIVVLRSLSFVFFVAFAVALFQNTALLGDRGLLPASVFLDRVREQNPSFPKEGLTWPMFNKYPTWLWLAPRGRMDDCLAVTSGFGMALSAFVLVNGGSNVMIQLTLWLLYHSLVTVGQRWYAFGWESQLLETGFISILMVPLLSVQALPVGVPTSWVSLWALRWLCFRIMIGAGMIKIRGDSCWRDLTAMCYHYETQPVPNPFSYFLHWTPVWWHKFETAANHVIELLLPWLLVCPVRSLVVLGGIAQLLFQTTLVLSGNLSFLNWLTMIPALGALDDAVVSLFFSAETVAHVQALNGAEGVWTVGDRVREGVYAGVCALLVWLSAPVMRNILSPNQVMNTSFGSWRFVNTYGAFGSITRVREEVILQGTHADLSDPVERWKEQEWREYEFKVKPGDVSRRPPWISPYHYRLDWLMWFLPFSEAGRHPWLYHLLGKLLANDNAVASLMRANPFASEAPPKFVRAELYRYEYAKPGSEEARKGQWWTRTRVGEYMEPTSLADIAHIYKQFGWPAEQVPTAPREGGGEGRERGTEGSAEEEGGVPTGKGSQASI